MTGAQQQRQEPAAARVVEPFHVDAHDYDPRATIEEALHICRRDADRLAFRALRPLVRDNGEPLLDHRGSPRQEVLAGTYDQLHRAAADLARLELTGGWHIYWHAQRVCAPVTNRLLPRNTGTVTAAGISAYGTLPVDLDPRAGAPPGAALSLAYEMTEFLRWHGVPSGAMLVMQTGRGAYVLVAIPPQPLTARPIIRDALRTLARLVDSTGATVAVDAGVHDPPRLLRVAGTTNRKPDADPTVPAWIRQAWEPGVHAPWSAIEELAAASRPRLRIVPGGRVGAAAGRRTTTPLRVLFERRGWLLFERPDGACDVRCPRADFHTDGRQEAILYPARDLGGPGWVKCLHAHCEGMTLPDVYRALGEEP